MKHIPVLLEEATSLLLGNGGNIYVDCTVGGAGHAKRILEKNRKAFLIGIDIDEEALEIAESVLQQFKGRYVLYKANFADLDLVLKEENIKEVDGFLFDLGVSLFQIKSKRGFSFQIEAPLDMRMDKEQKLTAYKVVNEYSEKELIKIFKDFGEEKLSRKIAKAIVHRRRRKPIETTKELADLIVSVYPPRARYGRIHPATRIFQALRIEVNRELDNLKKALDKTLNFLRLRSRVVVISFHSLEDRIVKRFFKSNSNVFHLITKKPVVPSAQEIRRNPSSRSAKLRAVEVIMKPR